MDAAFSWRRCLWAGLAFVALGLFSGSVYRAIHFPFTHDESLSFEGFHWEKVWAYGANNHLLNTFLMRLESRFLGDGEVFLRLHTLGAHLAYLVLSLFLLKRLRQPALIVAGFLMLNINPYLLDFFFAARGYGLALAFMMGSLLLLLNALDRKRSGAPFAALLVGASYCAIIATLSNYSFVNYQVPMLAASAWLLCSDESMRGLRLGARQLGPGLGILLPGAGGLLFVLREGIRLNQMGDLFYGGKTGFIPDTIGGMVRCGFYFEPVSEKAITMISYGIFGIFVALVGWCVFRIKSRGEIPAAVLLLGILACGAATTIAQHHLLHTLYPVERWAFCFVPPLVLALVFVLDEMASERAWLWAVLPAGAISLLLVGHWLRDYSLDAHYCWGYDRHAPEVLEIIDKDRRTHFGAPINVCSGNILEPSLSYYRYLRRYTWVGLLTRFPRPDVGYHYVYLFEDEITPELRQCSQPIVSFKDTKTVLLRLGENRR